MGFYSVEIWDKAFYPYIEADSPEQAEMIAEEWFYERQAAIQVQQVSPSCDKCYHFHNEDKMDSVSACNCCEDFSFFDLND